MEVRSSQPEIAMVTIATSENAGVRLKVIKHHIARGLPRSGGRGSGLTAWGAQ